MTRLYRKGDVVAIRAVVIRDQRSYEGENVAALTPTVAVQIDGQYAETYFPLDAIQLSVAHYERGDEIIHRVEKTHGTVLAVHDDVLWIDTEDGFETWLAADVDLAPARVAPEGGEA